MRGIAGRTEEIVRTGDFGLFHLLDAANVKPGYSAGTTGVSPVMIATWKLKSQPDSNVKIDIKPQRTDALFSRGFFSGLKCPRLITKGER